VDNGEVRRGTAGSIVGIVVSIGLGAAMLPLRPHLSIATAALVLVVPVVAGVATGGFVAGVVSVAAGFLVYDFWFTPPYGRLSVATSQEWVALGIYVAVMLLVARVVARLDAARAEALSRTVEARRLSELSELLVEDRSVEELLRTVVTAVATAFDVPGVALLVLEGDRLEIAASAGHGLSENQLSRLGPRSGVPVSLGLAPGPPDEIQTVALSAAGRPVGMLVLHGMPSSEGDRTLLRTFANHAALALERARLREQALRSELLEEVDRLRHSLLGAVSHDLRTPLATMKVASSALVDPTITLSADDTDELHGLIDVETDRLTRLVTSLLDMTRIDAGALEVRPVLTPVGKLVVDAVAPLRSVLRDRPVDIVIPEHLPDVYVDQLLIGQVLANLLDNANRHAPPKSLITVAGEMRGDRVALSVADAGPGVPPAEREAVFDRFVRFDTGGRTGLGLTIAKTFVEAHGERIWVEDVPTGGARFVFTLMPDSNPAPSGPGSASSTSTSTSASSTSNGTGR
jgi:two-component system sensor histidine kinase KdpD